MAKDDYYTLVANVLVYLYKRLKGKDNRPPEEYLCPRTKDFPIEPDYFDYVIRNMLEQGYIRGVEQKKVFGAQVMIGALNDIEITPTGIDYMVDNNKIRKVIETLPNAAQILNFFDLF